MEKKEAMQKRKDEVAQLKDCMDKNFKRAKDKFGKRMPHRTPIASGRSGARRKRKRTSKP